MSTVSDLPPDEYIELVSRIEQYVRDQGNREVAFEELSKQFGVSYKDLEMIYDKTPRLVVNIGIGTGCGYAVYLSLGDYTVEYAGD